MNMVPTKPWRGIMKYLYIMLIVLGSFALSAADDSLSTCEVSITSSCKEMMVKNVEIKLKDNFYIRLWSEENSDAYEKKMRSLYDSQDAISLLGRLFGKKKEYKKIERQIIQELKIKNYVYTFLLSQEGGMVGAKGLFPTFTISDLINLKWSFENIESKDSICLNVSCIEDDQKIDIQILIKNLPKSQVQNKKKEIEEMFNSPEGKLFSRRVKFQGV